MTLKFIATFKTINKLYSDYFEVHDSLSSLMDESALAIYKMQSSAKSFGLLRKHILTDIINIKQEH